MKRQFQKQVDRQRYDRGNPEGLVKWKDLEVYVQDQLTGLEQHLDRKHGPGSTIRWAMWHLGQFFLTLWGFLVIAFYEAPKTWLRNRRVAREHKKEAAKGGPSR